MTHSTESSSSITAAPAAAAQAATHGGLARRDRPALLTGAVAGIAFLLAGFVSPPQGPDMTTATAEQIRSFLAGNTAALRIATVAGLIGVVAALMFIACLTRLVRTRLPESMLADTVLAGGILLTIVYWLTVTTTAMALLLPGLIGADVETVEDGVLRGWYALSGFTHFLGDLQMAPLALLLTAFCVAALRGRLLPRWLAVVGLVLAGCAAVGLVGVATQLSPLYPLWFVALFGWVLWVLATSIVFLLRWRRLGR
jgi:hypothetical protein